MNVLETGPKWNYMVTNGQNWFNSERELVQFCGQDKCTVDANGRVKLSPRFLLDFGRTGNEVVVHCLPEGALGVYPCAAWAQMRKTEEETPAKAGRSILTRRELRRFGALSQTEQISNQGRITIPVQFRGIAGLAPATEAILVGCEIGLEIWSAEAWEREFQVLLEHEKQKAEVEMRADLRDSDTMGTTEGTERKR